MPAFVFTSPVCFQVQRLCGSQSGHYSRHPHRSQNLHPPPASAHRALAAARTSGSNQPAGWRRSCRPRTQTIQSRPFKRQQQIKRWGSVSWFCFTPPPPEMLLTCRLGVFSRRGGAASLSLPSGRGEAGRSAGREAAQGCGESRSGSSEDRKEEAGMGPTVSVVSDIIIIITSFYWLKELCGVSCIV